MSIREYETSLKLEIVALQSASNAFYSLIMSAMRCADDQNLEKLKRAFPEQWKELCARYNAPNGRLPGEDPVTVS